MSAPRTHADRIDLWLQYNGAPGWPGPDLCVIHEDPDAPLMRADIAGILYDYYRLRRQLASMKRQRDELLRQVKEQ